METLVQLNVPSVDGDGERCWPATREYVLESVCERFATLFGGGTCIEGTGFEEGHVQERVTLVQSVGIVTAETRDNVRHIARFVCHELDQRCVYVQYSDAKGVRTEFVEA